MVAGLAQGVLQGGDVLEAVAGHDPVVVVGGDQADGRVLTHDLSSHLNGNIKYLSPLMNNDDLYYLSIYQYFTNTVLNIII